MTTAADHHQQTPAVPPTGSCCAHGAPSTAAPDVAAAGALYTCPMHPQIRQAGPGSCPICGMALEPLHAAESSDGNAELRDMQRRFWIGMVLALPVVVLEMGSHLSLLNLHHVIGMRAAQWIQFLFATPVVLWAGWPFFVRAAASVRHRSLNMFSLIALGVGAAYLYSLVALFAPALLPVALHAADGSVALYFEASAVITVLVLLGQVLELRARERTGGAIRALLKLTPRIARRIDASGQDIEVPLEELRPGDRLRLRPRRVRAGGRRGARRPRRRG